MTTTIYSLYTDSAAAKQASVYSTQLAQEQTRSTGTLTQAGTTVFDPNSDPGPTATVVFDTTQSQYNRVALGIYSVLRKDYPTVTDFSHGTYTIHPPGSSPNPYAGGENVPYCIPQPTPTPMLSPESSCVCPGLGKANQIVGGGIPNVGLGYVPKYPGSIATGSDGIIMTMASGGRRTFVAGVNLYIIIAFVGFVVYAC